MTILLDLVVSSPCVKHQFFICKSTILRVLTASFTTGWTTDIARMKDRFKMLLREHLA